ncbi:MAG: MFS transporter [Bacteroidales bacterium]|nr:MFS transporter [Bacteroidales bacterium]
MAKQQVSERFQVQKVASISVAHLVHDVYTSFLNTVLPLLIEKFAMSLTLAGGLNLVLRIPSLLNPVIGIVADRIPVKWFIILTPAISAVGMGLLGLAPNIAMVIVLLFVVGLSSSFFHVPAPVLVRNVSGNRLGKGMSWYMLGGEAARTLGPLLIVAAVGLWGFAGIWKLIPFALLATIGLFFIFRHSSNTMVRKASGKRETGGATIWSYTRRLMPVLVCIAGVTFFQSMMKSALTGFLTVYLTGGGFSFSLAGILFAVFQFAGAASVLLTGTWSDRVGRIRMLQVASVTSPVFMWLFVTLGPYWVVPLLLLLGFTIFSTTPVILALLQEAGRERPSYINGLYMTMSFFTGAAALVLVGWLGDWYGLETTYKITAYVGLGMIPFVLLLRRFTR